MKTVRTVLFLLFFIAMLSKVMGQTDNDTILYKTDSLSVTYKTATYQNAVIYNADKELAALEKEDAESEFSIFYTPLSLVGNVLSYEKNTAVFPQGGYFNQNSFIETVNVVTRKPYSILNIADEKSLLKALKNDTYLKTSGEVDTLQLKKCVTFADALAVLDNQLSDYHHFSPYSYAILGYDDVENKVFIRLIRTLPRSMTLTEYLQLGLTVTPTKTFEKKLKKTGNFYLGTFRRGRLGSQSFYKEE